jgi:hypothetical protein
MRKNIFILVLALLVCMEAPAQQKLRFSIFANPCFNWLQSDLKTVQSGSISLGFDAGLTVDKFFADYYAISSGVSIGSAGGNLKYTGPTAGFFNFKSHGKTIKVPNNTTIKFKLQYITIPIGLKFKTKEIGYLTYFAHLGLTTQMNIKAIGTSSDANSSLADDNISDEINFFNLGYHIGAGAEYSIGGNTALVFGLTYTNGFVDITSSSGDKITTASIALRLGILF